ncbi:exopolyphosphatase, partial [Candidatus Micrarchaeota archaeon]|nr:exopolyphosphatase [Candidatus Micrarchaeota archaeon]
MKILTHNDFDGAVSAMLISCMEEIDGIRFTTPERIQRREIEVTKHDIIADLPFHPNCGMWFDHHLSNEIEKKFEGRFELAPSAARVVYNYYENPYLEKYKELLEATDRIDSGVVTLEDIKKPSGYYLLSITLELDKERWDSDYRRRLIGWLKDYNVEQILQFP